MYKRVLVPLDGSPLSECALEPAKTLVKVLGLKSLTLLMTVEPSSSMVLRGGFGTEDRIKAEQQAEAAEKEYLAHIAQRLEEEGIKSETVVVYGFAADEILNYSKKARIDLIVMSTHGRSGLSRWLTGSVATKVMNHSTIPVLVVPPHGCRTRSAARGAGRRKLST